MHHFFVDKKNIGEEYIKIEGSDVNHIKNVLRMKIGDNLLISNCIDKDYFCVIDDINEEIVKAKIQDIDYEGTELPIDIYLFQCLPKNDKMELIIQKSVELGVKEIIPVSSKRSVVKLDEKKAENKLKRWNTISESAAKQSRRVIIPKVNQVMSFKQAIEYASGLNMSIIPYENYKSMKETKEIISSIEKNTKIGIFIGPEGGFEEEEIDFAVEKGIMRISLGKRILRTETAGMTIMSVLMFKMEDGI